MRPTALRLAVAIGTTPPSFAREASVSLLPPLPLYRRLLRSHRNLPIEMRSLGDTYIKDEFRRHKTAENPIHIIGFLSQWKHYLDDIEKGDMAKGKMLDMDKLEKMSNEQVAQLYELMKETKDIWKTPEDLEAEKARLEAIDPLAFNESKDKS